MQQSFDQTLWLMATYHHSKPGPKSAVLMATSHRTKLGPKGFSGAYGHISPYQAWSQRDQRCLWPHPTVPSLVPKGSAVFMATSHRTKLGPKGISSAYGHIPPYQAWSQRDQQFRTQNRNNHVRMLPQHKMFHLCRHRCDSWFPRR